MTPKPIAIGLLLCDRVIVDKDTSSPSAIGIFTGLAVERFPSDPQRFSVLAVLTDAQGDGRCKLAVHRLNEHWLRQEEIYATEHTVRFPDRFAVVNFNLRVRTIRFPLPGSYTSSYCSLIPMRLRTDECGSTRPHPERLFDK